jgi:hypothetical protein
MPALPGDEHEGDNPFQDAGGQDPEQRDADGDGDGDVDHERGSRTQPHCTGGRLGGKDQGGEHRLVGQLAQGK